MEGAGACAGGGGSGVSARPTRTGILLLQSSWIALLIVRVDLLSLGRMVAAGVHVILLGRQSQWRARGGIFVDMEVWATIAWIAMRDTCVRQGRVCEETWNAMWLAEDSPSIRYRLRLDTRQEKEWQVRSIQIRNTCGKREEFDGGTARFRGMEEWA